MSEHRDRIDEILASYAEGWTIARMPGVDRAILRVGLYELLWRADVPDAVVIDEAVELAKLCPRTSRLASSMAFSLECCGTDLT